MNTIKNSIFSLFEGIAGIIPSFNPLIESLVKNIVLKYLGQYVDFQQFQLKSIQDIQLEDVNLKIEEINSKILYKSPFIMTYGQIGQMRIQIPIQDLLTKQSKADINKVEIHLRPNGKNISHDYFKKQENKEHSQDKMKEASDLDPNKVNELKDILIKIAINFKINLKDLVVKIFLQSAMSSDTSEEVYFMLRISKIKTNEDLKKSKIYTSPLKFDFLNQSSLETSFVSNPPNLIPKANSQEQLPSTNLQVSDINLFILKDSSLDAKEYQNMKRKQQPQYFEDKHNKRNTKSQPDFKFPYQYPPHNHPTNILHIPDILLNAKFEQNEKDLKLNTEMSSCQIMIEPYQLKILWKMVEIIECWQKQVKCLNLLLITKDDNIKDTIIENNKKWTKVETQQKSQRTDDLDQQEENSVDDLLYKTIVELEKSNKRDSKQFFQQSKPSQQQNQQSFFNQSILVHNNSLPHFGNQQNQENIESADLEQSAYFNKSQLSRIVDVSTNKSSIINTLSFRFELNKFCVYVMKGSERKVDKNSSIEYSREWKYSKKVSLVSQVEQSKSEIQESQSQNNPSSSKTGINLHIPTSYYMLKIVNLEFHFRKETNQKAFEAGLNSFELMDVLLMNPDPKQCHHKFKNFKLKNQQQSDLQKSMKEDVLKEKITSSFWKNKSSSEECYEEQRIENRYLIKYQISKESHYCVNYIIYYNFNPTKSRQQKLGNKEDLKIHRIVNDFWTTEKKEKRERFKNIQKNKKRDEQDEESQYEYNVRQIYTDSYDQLKGKSEGENSQNNMQGINSPLQHAFFSMVFKNNQQSKQKTSENKQQREELQHEEICANFVFDKLFINIDMKIMHDIALISSPLSKYAHYCEQICKDLDTKIPKYEVPNEIKKLLKSLNKNEIEFDIRFNMISCNLLTYGFNDFFISSKGVDNIYSNYAKWGCLCEVTDQMKNSKKQNCYEEQKNQRGSYKPSYLNISWINPEILFVQKKDININFNEINVFLVNYQKENFHKIVHIGRNFVLTQQNNQNHLELTYPSILKYRVQKEEQKDVVETLSKQIIQNNGVEKKVDVNTFQRQSSKEDQQEIEDKKQQSSKSQDTSEGKGSKDNYDDRFYHDNEQNPDLNKVKIGLNIGIPVLELYITDEDLSILGDFVFSMVTFMNIIDQFKYKSATYKNFFEDIQNKAILQSDNLLIRMICSEVNIHYSKEEFQGQNNQSPLFNSKSKESQCYRLPNDMCLRQNLIFHIKDMSFEVLFNKEIKREDCFKNFKLTMKMSIGINTLIVIDNALPNFISNQNFDNLQNELDSTSDFPKNIHLFRVQSVFLGAVKQENILIYKMNLSSSCQNSYQELYNLMAGRHEDDHHIVGENNINAQKKKAKQMILAVKTLQQRIASIENQLSLQMIFKKKQHEVPFREAKSKQQIDIRGLCLNQSVISLLPLSQSNLILHFFESIQKFMLQDKINSEIMIKNEFKEILIRDLILFRDVKIDIFPTPSCQLYKSFGQLLTTDVLEFIRQSKDFKLEDRFMSNYRAVLSVDKLHIEKFQKREQRNCSKPIKISQMNEESDEKFYEEIEKIIKQQNQVEKLCDILELKVNKIQLDFLYQKDFNPRIDPLMIDFMFTNNSDLAIQSMGFSKVAILFDVEFNKLNSEIMQLKIDGIQLGFFTDTLSSLPYFIDVLIFSLKNNSEQNKYIIKAINQVKTAIDQKDLQVQMAIFKTKVQKNNSNLDFHSFYPSNQVEDLSWVHKRVFQSGFNSHIKCNLFEQPVKEVDFESEELDEMQQNHGDLKLEPSYSSQFEQLNDSFEKIDGEYAIDEKTFKENNKIIIEIQFVKISLQEGLGFNFTSVNSNYNVNKQMFLQMQRQESEQRQNQQQSQQLRDQQNNNENISQSKAIKNQLEKQENDMQEESSKSNEKQENIFNIKIDNEWLKNKNLEKEKAQASSEQNILIVRERAAKKSAESLLVKIENILFQIKTYMKNDQNIDKQVRVEINKILAENELQKHICLCTEKQSDSMVEQFLNLSFFISSQEKIIENKLRKDQKEGQLNANVESQTKQKIKLVNNSIRQIDLSVHQIIKLSLSSQVAEMLKKLFKKQSLNEKKENKKILEDQFQKLVSRHFERLPSQSQMNKINPIIKEIEQDDNEDSFRIEKITLIDELFIPEIKIFISNKKEGFDFSRLAKENGYFQIINIGEFHEIQITLVQMTIYDMNIDSLGKTIVEKWMKEIKGNQKWQVASQLPLIKNIANIGEGIFDLFYQPYSYYQQGMSVLDGTYQGVKKFVTSTTQESINLTSAVFSSLSSLIMKNAKGASNAISKAKNYFSENSGKNNQNNN